MPFQFRSVLCGSCELGEAHNYPFQALRSFPNVAHGIVPVLVILTMALSHPFKEDRLALSLSMPLSSRRSMVEYPCFALACRVSSSRTLQIFQDTSHLWCLLCRIDYALGHFPSLGHVQRSAFEGACGIIIIIDNFCIALFSGVHKLTALYNILQPFLIFTNIIHIIMTTNNVWYTHAQWYMPLRASHSTFHLL